jgi:hypothetical protein
MDEIENILINLKVLQSLQCHTRLDTTESLFKIHTAASWVPAWVKRWWASQNRVTDIGRVRNLYSRASEHIGTDGDNGRMKEYLKLSLPGLNNLKTTYNNDVTTAALIDVIIDNVNRLLS